MDKTIICGDYIDFNTEWLDIEDIQLKLLMLSSLLAENNLAYRGTLNTMCEWLGITASRANNNRIKQALDNLQNNGYIFYKKDSDIYTITISNKGFEEKTIVEIRKIWIETIKAYNKDENNQKINKNISLDWIKILKVFVFILTEIRKQSILTYDYIGSSLNISKETVRKAVIAIKECCFDGITIDTKTKKKKIDDDMYITIGTEYTIGLDFDSIEA